MWSSAEQDIQISQGEEEEEEEEYSFDMGNSALDNDDLDSDVYLALGSKDSNKGVPRALSLLSSLLERFVQMNETLQKNKQVKDMVTVFHGVRAPTLSIQQYIDRIFNYAGCSPSCLVVAYIYVDRFLQCTGIHLNSLNVHRLLVTSVMIAAKFNDDAFFNNAYYAKVGGVTTAELNKLELKFLFSLDFRLHVSVETFKLYCSQLEKESYEGLQIERTVASCRVKKSWPNRKDSSCAPKICARTSAQ